jgi:hypothetical protein
MMTLLLGASRHRDASRRRRRRPHFPRDKTSSRFACAFPLSSSSEQQQQQRRFLFA